MQKHPEYKVSKTIFRDRSDKISQVWPYLKPKYDFTIYKFFLILYVQSNSFNIFQQGVFLVKGISFPNVHKCLINHAITPKNFIALKNLISNFIKFN